MPTPLPTVLLVEDDEAISSATQLALEMEGYQVRCAYNGVDGLKALEAFKPNVVLLDVMMPRLNGYEVLERIRQQEEYKDIRVIMLTARGQEADRSRSMEMGADGYMVKPFNENELFAKIDSLLK